MPELARLIAARFSGVNPSMWRYLIPLCCLAACPAQGDESSLNVSVASNISAPTKVNGGDTPDVVVAKWRRERQRIIDYLNDHRSATPDDLHRLLPMGLPTPDDLHLLQPMGSDVGNPQAAQLDDRTWLISEPMEGGIYAATLKNGRFTIAWDLGWTAEDARNNSENCGGPMNAPIGKLPDTKSGDHRFYVVTTICTPAGWAYNSELTVYKWHDGIVTRQVNGDFLHSIDDSATPELQGRILHLTVWGEDKSFYATGPDGPEFDWRILLSPNETKDLGQVPADRERDLVDRLFDRIHRGKPANDLATMRVISRLRISIRNLPSRGEGSFLGEITDWTTATKGHGGDATACLSTDASRPSDESEPTKWRTFKFTFIYPNGQPYVSNVEVLSPPARCTV